MHNLKLKVVSVQYLREFQSLQSHFAYFNFNGKII